MLPKLLLTLCVTVILGVSGTAAWMKKGAQRQRSETRLSVSDSSGAPLKSFFADVIPNRKIADAVKAERYQPTSCRKASVATKGGTVLERVGRMLDIATPVHAQAPCCPTECPCLSCNQFVTSYLCNGYCDGGNYSYAYYDSAYQCTGSRNTDPRNCLGQCECGVTSCYNGQACGC
jgi:hypothetical protein